MKALQQTVQNNCHISDAQYAGNYTLCIYLLKMREYFRWESGHPYGASLDNGQVGAWLTEREALWDSLDDMDFSALTIDGASIDPFETRQVNARINQQGLVYSGGFGLHGKPVFFLAELEQQQHYDDYTLYVSSRELARDLAAPPGMSLDKCVFIRRESLRRFLWEKIEESAWYKNENALARALAFYDFKNQPEESLDRMTDTEVDTLLQHEIGEIKAGQLLGDEWENMLINMPRSQAEIMLRAVRDHMADALSTLPQMLKNAEPAQMHFYFANLGSMRKVIFPSLMDAYQQWHEHNDLSPIRKLVNKAETHWLTLAKSILALYKKHGEDSYPHMESLIKSNYL
jgi:hypothetical protein